MIIKNVLLGVVSHSYQILVTFLCTPFFIKIFGQEGYGIVSFFAIVMTVFNFLDFGVIGSITREFAAANHDKPISFEYVRGMEFFYYILGVFAVFVLTQNDVLFVDLFINSNKIDHSEVLKIFHFMLFIALLRWISSFYKGVLIGSSNFTLNYILNIIITSCRYPLSFLVIYNCANPLISFFEYQLAASVLEFSLFIYFVYIHKKYLHFKIVPRIIYSKHKDKFNFSIAILITSVISVLIPQYDKLLISANMNIKELGYFSLITMVSSVYAILTYTLSTITTSRLTNLYSAGKIERFIEVYFSLTQLYSALGSTLTLVLLIFPKFLFTIWLGDNILPDTYITIFKILVLNSFITIILSVVYQMQFAIGDLRLHYRMNIFYFAIYISLSFFVFNAYSLTGLVALAVILNIFLLIFWTWYCHSFFKIINQLNWFLNCIIIPMLPSLLIYIAVNFFKPANSSTGFIELLFIVLFSLILNFIFLKIKKSYLTNFIFSKFIK